MNKSAQILEEAEAAAQRAAALTATYRKADYSLRIEDPEMWQNVFILAGIYDQLAKALRARAKLEEEREKAQAAEPCPVFANSL